jgi:hypothetical protein
VATMTVHSTPAPHLLPVLRALVEQDQRIDPTAHTYPCIVTPEDLAPRHIQIATKFIDATVTLHINLPGSSYDESEPIHLRSIISAYRPSDYRFPWGCVAYTAEKPTPLYHDRTFHPSAIDFLFHDDGRKFAYRLVSGIRRDEKFNMVRKGPAESFSVFSFYCEGVDGGREFPVQVLFKKAEDGKLRFHTTMVPLALMELIVLNSGHRLDFY